MFEVPPHIQAFQPELIVTNALPENASASIAAPAGTRTDAKGPATHMLSAIMFRSIVPTARVYHQQAYKLNAGHATGSEPGVSPETGTAGIAVMMAGPITCAGGCRVALPEPLLQVQPWWRQAQQCVQGGCTT